MIKNPPPLSQSIVKYEAFDGLRVYAAIGIVLMHVLANITIKPDENFLTVSFIPYLTYFTRLFMVVSAFSMCCGYYDRVKNGLITPKAFYQKRYKRILPFFAIIVVLSVLIDRDMRSLQEGFLDVTLCFNLLPSAHIETVGVGWFLGTVFTFYMLFPFFTYLLDSKLRSWWVMIVALLMVYVATHPLFKMGEIGASNIIYSGPFFIAGGIIYLYRQSLSRLVSSHRFVAILLTICISVAVFILPVNGTLPITRNLIFFSVLTIYALGSNDWILNNRVTRYLSKISMEIYLCHMMFFRVASMLHLEKFVGDNNLLYILTAITTIAGAICFSHVVKLYLLPYMERMTDRLRTITLKT